MVGKNSTSSRRTQVVDMILPMVAVAGPHSSAEQDIAPPVLRGRAIEIADVRGRVRASITVLTNRDGRQQGIEP